MQSLKGMDAKDLYTQERQDTTILYVHSLLCTIKKRKAKLERISFHTKWFFSLFVSLFFSSAFVRSYCLSHFALLLIVFSNKMILSLIETDHEIAIVRLGFVRVGEYDRTRPFCQCTQHNMYGEFVFGFSFFFISNIEIVLKWTCHYFEQPSTRFYFFKNE